MGAGLFAQDFFHADRALRAVKLVPDFFETQRTLNFLGQREVYVASSDGQVVATASLDGNVVDDAIH